MRRFSLYHHRSTMKVGTDAIVLGAWVNLERVRKILDVGTGCGILALMMAQRCDATVHAVELDEASAIEARENFSVSQWSSRMQVFHTNFVSFASQTHERYDLIISNPPFFNSAFKPRDKRRSLARQIDALPYDDLIKSAINLLNKSGRLAVVLPVVEGENFMEIAKSFDLSPARILKIIPVEGRMANRLNIEFYFGKYLAPTIEQFTIRRSDGSFTMQYHQALKDFYLGL
jgi:tRNA1Val (adenine37-N6)-methyltransferase